MSKFDTLFYFTKEDAYLCDMISPLTSYVAFTGHRTYRHEADHELRAHIRRLYSEGKRTFLSGMAVGFDLAAAEAVLACRAEYPEIRLIAVIPFEGQDRKFSPDDRQRFRNICDEADETVVLAEHFHPSVYAVRNNYLVAHADTLVTWYDGSAGGTRYTIQRAAERHRTLIHLHPHTPTYLQAEPLLF